SAWFDLVSEVRRKRPGWRSVPTQSSWRPAPTPGRSRSGPPAWSSAADQVPRVPGDHQLLVRGDHVGGDPAGRARDLLRAARIRGRVELQAEPCGVLEHPLSNRGGVLADPSGEDQRVQPSQGGRERAELPSDAVGKELDGEPRTWRVGGKQRAHVT